MNKLTNEQQLKIIKQHLEESIELDEWEDMKLVIESKKSFPETLTNKQKFQEIIEKSINLLKTLGTKIN